MNKLLAPSSCSTPAGSARTDGWGRWLMPPVALLCASLASAQTPTQTPVVVALQTVVVSGSRNERPRDELPLSMDVLGADDLEDAQAQDIRDLVRGLPNVSVKHAPARFTVTGAGNSTGRDGNAGFNVRGQDGNRVLMLVDGVRLPRSYINGNNAFGRDTLSLDLLKRVELVRGPSSVLYGSDALAGLVNFVTLAPSDFLLDAAGGSKAVGGRLALGRSGDDRGTRVAATVAARAGDTAQWLLTTTAYQAHAVGNMGRVDAANVNRTTPNPQTDLGRSALGKLVLQPTAAQRHVFTLEHVDRDSDVELLSSRATSPLTAASVTGEDARRTLRRDRAQWEARYTLQAPWADRVQTLLATQRTTSQDNGHTRRRDGGVRVRDTSYDERAGQFGVQADRKRALSARWTQHLTYGLDHARTDVTSWFGGFDPAPLPTYVPKKYFPDTRDASTALYVQDEFSDGRWRITPGLRLEHFSLRVLRQDGFAPPSPTPGKSLSGSNVSPKLGALIHVTPQWSVFAHYTAGVRAPNAAQVNGFTENPTPTTFVKLLPNPDLQPETSRNLELGLRARLDRMSLDAAVFTGEFRDLIVDKKPLGGEGVAGDPLLFQTVNIDRARIQGLEFKANVDWGDVASGAVSTSLAYGQARGKDRATGLPLNSIDPAKLVLGLKYAAVQWDLSLEATHHAAKTEDDLDSPYLPKPVNPPRLRQFTVPAATTVDLHLQWRVRRDLRVHLAVVSLSNRKYWRWSDVQGQAATSSVLDAYTQPGRHVNLSWVADF